MNNRFYICFILLYSSLASSQVISNKLTDNTIGGGNTDMMTTILKLENGDLLLGGVSNSNIGFDKSQNIYGGNDIWLVKVTNTSAKIWDKQIGGNSDDYLSKIIHSNSGDFYLLGNSSSDSGYDKSNDALYPGFLYPSSDFWVLKYDKDFNKIWDVTIGGTLADHISDAVINDNNELIIAGSSNSYLGYNKTEDKIGLWDYWIVKLDSNGLIIWDNTIGGLKDDKAKVIVQSIDSGYLIGGNSMSESGYDKSESNIGLNDIWLCKLNEDGVIEWDHTIGGTSDDFISSIIPLQDGGYFIGGYSNSEIGFDKTDSLIGGFDYWLIRINSMGEVLWDKTYGGVGDDILVKLVEYSDTTFIMAGYSNSNIGYDKSENSKGLSDYWILKIDSLGETDWDKTYGSYNNDLLADIVPLGNEVILAGGSSASGSNADKSEIPKGPAAEMDYWAIISYPGEVGFLADTVICPSDPFEVNEGEFSITEGYYYIIVEDSLNSTCYIQRVLFSDTLLDISMEFTELSQFNCLLLDDSTIVSYTFYFCDTEIPVLGAYFDYNQFDYYFPYGYSDGHYYGFQPSQTSSGIQLNTYVKVHNACGIIQTDCENFWVLNSIKDNVMVQKNPVIFPNPAHNVLSVLMPADESGSCTIKLFTLTGELIKTEFIKYIGGEISQIEINNIVSGIYVINIETEKNVFNSNVFIY